MDLGSDRSPSDVLIGWSIRAVSIAENRKGWIHYVQKLQMPRLRKLTIYNLFRFIKFAREKVLEAIFFDHDKDQQRRWKKHHLYENVANLPLHNIICIHALREYK